MNTSMHFCHQSVRWRQAMFSVQLELRLKQQLTICRFQPRQFVLSEWYPKKYAAI